MPDKILMESSRKGYILFGVLPLAYVVFSAAMIVNKLLALQAGLIKLDVFLVSMLVVTAGLTLIVFFFCLRAGHLQVGEQGTYFKNIFTAAYQTIPYEKIKSVDAFIILFGYKVAYQLTLKDTPRWRSKLIFFGFKHRPGPTNPATDPLWEYLGKRVKK